MRIIFFIFFVLITSFAFGQEDSVKVPSITVQSISADYSTQSEFTQFDTLLNTFYHYNVDGGDYAISMGNEGLSYGSLLFQDINYGFSSGEHSFDRNFKDPPTNQIYHTNVPFASAKFVSGPKKYEDFNIFYTQNVNKGLNFMVDFATVNSDGFYAGQNTQNHNFKFQNSYKTYKGDYGYLFYFKVNSGFASENGGIKNDSLYGELIKLPPSNLDNDKLRVSVWLDDDSNHYDYRKLYFSQFYKLPIARFEFLDSNEIFVGLVNQGGYDDVWFSGFNSDSNYYNEFNIVIPDSSNIYDESHLFYSQNKGYLRLHNVEHNYQAVLGFNYNYYENRNVGSTQRFSETSINALIRGLKIGQVGVSGGFEKGLAGYNAKGFLAQFTLDYETQNKAWLFTLHGKTQKSLPEYKMLNYSGNYIAWENDFKYIENTGVNLNVINEKFNVTLRAEYEIISNFVYYSSNVIPVQATGVFGRHEIEMKKKFTFGVLHVDLSILNQGVSDGAPVNLANWIGKISIYHQQSAFKDALEFRYGVDYWQNSSYNGMGYAPFTRSFIYQDTEEIGGFPYFSLFASIRVKTVQIFGSGQNIGQYLFHDNYMMVPGYGLNDFGISFGIRWDFYN